MRTVLSREVNEDNYTQLLADEFGITAASFVEAYEQIKSTVNYIRNPCGEQGYEHWTVGAQGGNGWAIESEGTYNGKSKVFVSSYSWCELSQVVKISAAEPLTACLSAWIARRWDCEAEGMLKAQVIHGREEMQIHESPVTACSNEAGSGMTLKWTRLSLTFAVPIDATAIKVFLRGKDKKFWAGFYGCRFGWTSLKLTSREPLS
jgi:hypothetical protein